MMFASSYDLCSKYQQKCHYLCDDLNLPIKESKTVLPTTRVELHGLMVDTVAWTVRLPQDKCTKANAMLQDMSHRKTVTLHNLQSLIGVLNVAWRAIEVAAHSHAALLTSLLGVTRSHHHADTGSKEG